MATIKIKTNYDCSISIDGIHSTIAQKDKITRINIQFAGMYYVESTLILPNELKTVLDTFNLNVPLQKNNIIELPNDNYEYLLIIDFDKEYFNCILTLAERTIQIHKSARIDTNFFSALDGFEAGFKLIEEKTLFKERILECKKEIQDQRLKAIRKILDADCKRILELNCYIDDEPGEEHGDEENSITIIYLDYGFEIKLPYSFVREFEYGFAIVSNDGKYGIIDKAGNLVLPCQYGYIEFLFPGKKESTEYLHGIIKESEYSKDVLHFFTIYLYDGFTEFIVDLHENTKCVYNKKLGLVAMYTPIKDYMEKNGILNEYDIGPWEPYNNIEIVDSECSDWIIPIDWGEIKEITNNQYIIYYEPNEGYGIATIDLEHHCFRDPLIDNCKEIFYLGGDFFALRKYDLKHEPTDVEKYFLRKKDDWRINESTWKFSETANIFNSDFFNPHYGIISNTEISDNEVPCAVYYIDHEPNFYCDLPTYKDLVVEKRKIYGKEWGDRLYLEIKAYGYAGIGEEVTDFMREYFHDWKDYVDLN